MRRSPCDVIVAVALVPSELGTTLSRGNEHVMPGGRFSQLKWTGAAGSWLLKRVMFRVELVPARWATSEGVTDNVNTSSAVMCSMNEGLLPGAKLASPEYAPTMT